MRDIHKLCKICLNPGSRDIFDSNIIGNIVSRDELNRIAEKLRFVTLLKVSPKENLPQQICDLCIVQLNVSYNFKRLALKNDFYIRQYMIENGMNLTKEDEEHNVSTSLEIHQIHNVIRTSNCYRPQPAIPSVEMRRNSTTSSVSGVSMLANVAATNESTNDNHFAHPTRPFVQPIQIKTEPIDPDYEDTTNNNGTNVTNQSSPSSSSNGSLSVLTVNSSEKSVRTRPKTPPMVVINGHIATEQKTATKKNEPTKNSNSPAKKVKIVEKQKELERPRNAIRNLRTIKKPTDQTQVKRKLREAARKMIELQQKPQKEAKNKKKKKKTSVNERSQKQTQGRNSSKTNAQKKNTKPLVRPKKQYQQQPKKSHKGKSHKRT